MIFETQPPKKGLVEIRFYGHMRKRFGRRIDLAVKSAAEAVRALCVVMPGFKQYMHEHQRSGFRVWLGHDPIKHPGELRYPCGRLIRIVPAVGGAGGGGGQILLGAALVGLSFVPGLNVAIVPGLLATTYSSLAFSLGVSMIIGGVSQALASSPKAAGQPSERPDNQPSYAFNGPVNTTGQGNPVPILYGRLRVGSQVISAGLSVAQLPA